MDSQYTGIIIAVCVILLSLIFYLIQLRKRTARRGVIIAGLSNTGKTLLFARLIHNKFVRSHTSIQENVAQYATEKGQLQIVDIPGHERLREKYLEEYKKSARGIVFLIDSSSFQREIRDIAELLYVILSDSVIAANCKNVLIFCNKQDNPTAKGASVIKSQLEKEMNTVRMTKASQLTSTEDSGIKNVYLGKENADFEFSHCSPTVFEFGEGAILNETPEAEPNMDIITEWLNAIS